MDDLITTTFFSILAAGFFVGIVVGLTGMGGGALMTPALIFLGVGDAATVVTADLTAAAIYKTGGAIVHAREGSPNLHLAKWLILGSVPMALLGPHLVAGAHQRRGGARLRPQDGDRLRSAAGRVDVRAAALHQPAPGPQRQPGRRPEPADPPAADPAGRRPRRPARRHHQRRLRLGDHGRAADALPRAGRGAAGRHRPRAGRARWCWRPRSPTSRSTASTGTS